MRFRRLRIAEEPALDPETRKWLIATVAKRSEITGYIDGTEPRYESLRCEFCQGVHFRACPRVAEKEWHPTGALARVRFWREGTYDDSDVIWPEDVFDHPPEADSTPA